MRIAIAIATFRRPGGLARLLGALARLEVPAAAALEVVVVDNDPKASAAGVAAAWRRRLPFPLRYLHEPRRGVSQARNRALACTEGAELVAFVDDDETPPRGWLRALLEVQERTGAAAVTGPVEARFETPVRPWFRAAFERCYIRPRPGRRFDEVTAANLLLDRRALRRHDLWFDPRLGLTGGEDTKLARDLVARGETIAWAPDAALTEWIPASRARLGWLLRRWYRTGNTEALLAIRGAAGRRRARALSLARGLARIAAGGVLVLAFAPIALLGSAGPLLHRLYTLARGLGMVGGVLGRAHEEYLTIHGT